MSAAKTERLVKLTMALLGSRRYMPKSEIFRRVEGYSGSQETMERMFERDKDELRALGIQIEVATQDPLFEDEPGYRIRPETYQMPQTFTPEELGAMTTAMSLLADSEISPITESILRRLNSLPDAPQGITGANDLPNNLLENGILDITKAMSKRTTIRFNYQKLDSDKAEVRRVNVMGLSAWRGEWYVLGEDLDRDDIRSFKLSRFTSNVEAISKPDFYDIPEDFDVRDYLLMFQTENYEVEILLRKGSGLPIRSRAKAIKEIDDEWDSITASFFDEATALREVLWQGKDCIVQSPESLRKLVVEAFRELAGWHD